jgi:hypothetical protein
MLSGSNGLQIAEAASSPSSVAIAAQPFMPEASKHPTMLGIAVGAVAAPDFQATHAVGMGNDNAPWLSIPGDVQHFPHGAS